MDSLMTSLVFDEPWAPNGGVDGLRLQERRASPPSAQYKQQDGNASVGTRVDSAIGPNEAARLVDLREPVDTSQTVDVDEVLQRKVAADWLADIDARLGAAARRAMDLGELGFAMPTHAARTDTWRLLRQAALAHLTEPTEINPTKSGGFAVRFHTNRYWAVIECFNHGVQTLVIEDWETDTAVVGATEPFGGGIDMADLLDRVKAALDQGE